MNKSFESFDPLKVKSSVDTEVAALAQKREINNILSSYVGWYDPFCELIQNSLDSLEERVEGGEIGYVPTISITVDIQKNSLSVTDNGMGLEEVKFTKFLCPDISFKSGKTRGHKGVGATYLAYGFNYIQVCTKTPDFQSIGKMEGARDWLVDNNPPGNPQMKYDSGGSMDANFDSIDRGVSITVKFDKNTHPKDLKWISSDKADSWYKILSIKTGLGAFSPNDKIKVKLSVVDRNGEITLEEKNGIEYYWINNIVSRSSSIKEIEEKQNELFEKNGPNFILPAKFKNLDAYYQKWTYNDIISLSSAKIKLEPDEIEAIKKYKVEVYIAFVYSLKIWESFHGELNVRSGAKIIFGGIQIAANNMPQGELIQIPLNRNIGRQNQIHCVIHFSNCSADLGRKGFKSEIVELAKELTKKLSDGPLMKFKSTLRPNTGASANLSKEKEVEDWKREMLEHESNNPLSLISENFFLPTNSVSITSIPTREQDVIALFNQLIAGGVIRGVTIMSTNERLTYDGLYKVIITHPNINHLYDSDNNPLGIEQTVLDDFTLPFVLGPKILEYKFSLDGLIEDIEGGEKNSNDIGLVVVWETGEKFRDNYHIVSYLDPDNLTQREYHGITHGIINLNNNQKEMDLIVLSELISFLNNQSETIRLQIEKYEG